MNSKIEKAGKKAGRTDRGLRRKLIHRTKRCVHCKALNLKHVQNCWRCGKPL